MGLLPLPGRDRSAGWHLDHVATVRQCQPDVGGNRTGPLHRRPVQDETAPLRLGYHCAGLLARGRTVTAGLEKVFNPNPAVGFISHAFRFGDAASAGQILAPAKTLHEISRLVFNDYVDATLAAVFAAIVVTMVVYGVFDAREALSNKTSTVVEVGGDAVRWRERAMIETVVVRSRFVCEMAVKTARLMVGIPDYQTYVTHRRTTHPDRG